MFVRHIEREGRTVSSCEILERLNIKHGTELKVTINVFEELSTAEYSAEAGM